MLCPTPIERLCDAHGRPTFLWDCDLTLSELKARLTSPDLEVRAYWIGTVMRQAKPDDALTLVAASEMREYWPKIVRYLGRERPFWEWYLARIVP